MILWKPTIFNKKAIHTKSNLSFKHDHGIEKLSRDKHNFYDELNYPNNALLGSNIPGLLLFCVISQRH